MAFGAGQRILYWVHKNGLYAGTEKLEINFTYWVGCGARVAGSYPFSN
jgi:hypothetical protein